MRVKEDDMKKTLIILVTVSLISAFAGFASAKPEIEGKAVEYSFEGVVMKGVASFHGGLAAVKPAQAGAVKAKILVLQGADDKFITQEQIGAFKQEMKTAGADFRFIAYPGAIHSFTNPEADEYAKKFNLPLGYNAEADKKSWEELRKFLAMIFKK